MKNTIQDLCRQIFPEIVEIRRHLHRHPELSQTEEKTAAYICSKLDEWKISYEKNIGGFGVVALIKGGGDGSCIALRADMDALPIVEENDFEYTSANKGVMHACGHDAHTANLLGVAYILSQISASLKGSIKLIFQASEECFPGGAIKMIESGVLENPYVDVVMGMHVSPELESGVIGMKPGMYMASTDEIYLTVKGKGGHAATPEKVNDPIIASAHILLALQQIVSRHADPGIPSVLSFGRIEGMGRTNIIPDVVKIEGTLRTFNEEWRKLAHELIRTKASLVAQANMCECKTEIVHGYPFLVNDPELTDKIRALAAQHLPELTLIDLPLRMTAEDFAYFSQNRPSLFFRLGTGNEKKKTCFNLHTSRFNVDEEALKSSMLFMSGMAVLYLNREL